jgi:hypothetical protein
MQMNLIKGQEKVACKNTIIVRVLVIVKEGESLNKKHLGKHIRHEEKDVKIDKD